LVSTLRGWTGETSSSSVTIDTVARETDQHGGAAGSSGQLVGGLLNGLAILDLFSEDEPVLGVGEIARRLGIHKSSASRLAATLSTAGYLQPAGRAGRYQLGAKLIRLAGIVPDAADLPQIALPVLHPLVQRLGETGHIARLDGTETVTLAVVDGWRNMRMHSTAGKRSPAHATAIGKALLATLPPAEVERLYADIELEQRTPATIATVAELLERLVEVRRGGYALDNEELETGLRCVAAPVFDHGGRAVAAVGVSGPAARMEDDTLEAIAADVRAAADGITLALGGQPTSAYAE
jgi:DNA-binding IclR family transcriptional regulator